MTDQKKKEQGLQKALSKSMQNIKGKTPSSPPRPPQAPPQAERGRIVTPVPAQGPPPEDELSLAQAQAKVAKTEVEAAKARAEIAKVQVQAAEARITSLQEQSEAVRAQAESAGLQAEAAKAQKEAAQAQVASANAQAEAARAQSSAAQAQTEAAKVQAEAAVVAAEQAQGHATLVRNQLETLEEQLAVARRRAASGRMLATLTGVAALGTLGLGAVAVYALVSLQTSPVIEETARTISEAASAGTAKALAAELEAAEERTEERTKSLEADLAAARDHVDQVSEHVTADEAGSSTKRISVTSPDLRDDSSWSSLSEWLESSKGEQVEGSESLWYYSLEGSIQLPAKGAVITVHQFLDQWVPAGGPFAVHKTGSWRGKVRLAPSALPSRLRFNLQEGSQASSRVYEIAGNSPPSAAAPPEKAPAPEAPAKAPQESAEPEAPAKAP
jgi:hypothetical protein